MRPDTLDTLETSTGQWSPVCPPASKLHQQTPMAASSLRCFLIILIMISARQTRAEASLLTILYLRAVTATAQSCFIPIQFQLPAPRNCLDLPRDMKGSSLKGWVPIQALGPPDKYRCCLYRTETRIGLHRRGMGISSFRGIVGRFLLGLHVNFLSNLTMMMMERIMKSDKFPY